MGKNGAGFALAASAALMSAPPANACGGGGVTTASRVTVADAQRILISVRERTTEVVAQISVPETNGDYGVLIPVPAEPMIDEHPVPVAELDALDEATMPMLSRKAEDDGFSCGCGSSKNGGDAEGVSVSKPVDVGPVTAVVLNADSGDALGAWLATNGFLVPSEHQGLVDESVAEGNRFIAIKRNDAAATGGPTSIGIHYTLPGDHRKLSLRFARLGAAPEVAFTVFIAARGTVAPTAPFEALTLEDLAQGAEIEDYGLAVRELVRDNGGRAFVLESSTSPASFAFQTPLLSQLFSAGVTLTRASTIISAENLDADPSFTVPHPDVRRYASSPSPTGAASVASLGVLAALGALRKRRARPRRSGANAV